MVLVSRPSQDSSEGSMVETTPDHHERELKELKEALTDALEGSYVQRAVKEFHLHSNLECSDEVVPNVNEEDLTVGDTIGKGGFAIVKAVEWNGQELAMKQLRDSIVQCDSNGDTMKLDVAAADLIKEAEFLSALTPHPNIVGIHAKHVDMQAPGESFIVLDRLEQTLLTRMDEWRERDAKLKKRNPKQRERFLQERLQVCLDICKTLQYLHEKNVIYRDLKAENLGFDAEGNVRLFGE